MFYMQEIIGNKRRYLKNAVDFVTVNDAIIWYDDPSQFSNGCGFNV